MSVIVCFIDGVGLLPAPAPPWTTAHLPTLSRLLGAVPHSNLLIDQPRLYFRAIDATLGVEGLPQSGTGHTSLWTGVNASALLGRHYPAYPAPSQRPMIAEQSLFAKVQQLGRTSLIATVHRDNYWELVAKREQRATAAAFAAQVVDLALPATPEWRNGQAVTWDITGAYLQQWGALAGLPTITAHEAGLRLGRALRLADFVHYECYLPDFVGHRRIAETPERTLELIDHMLGSLLSQMQTNDSLIVVSDHGNLEMIEHTSHSRNPVPLLVVGANAQRAAKVADISQITPLILDLLSIER
ncbi:alkaline phosphatase family protein [Herpetosiphon geysericola]|uniref:alkaline phosphatase family protein n=1 Tax=Herpetosiphon geysericola TaxID=70996 RepID=UPI0006C8F767|nr:alkaline phosphatase family protein [Herpetosiphon geysericola]